MIKLCFPLKKEKKRKINCIILEIISMFHFEMNNISLIEGHPREPRPNKNFRTKTTQNTVSKICKAIFYNKNLRKKKIELNRFTAK